MNLFGGGSILAVFIIVVVLLRVFYLMTLFKIMEKVRPENRLMPAAHVWLYLIPLFNIVWKFIAVSNVSRSVAKECSDRSIWIDDAQAYRSLGLTYCGLLAAALVPIPLLRNLLALAGLVIWMIYWSKMARYSKMLEGGFAEDQPLDAGNFEREGEF